jgi:GTP-binding protein
MLKTVDYEISASSWQSLPEGSLDEVAFIGRSNVGKSSLLNMIAGRKNLARISGQPGKTRTFNFYRAEPRQEPGQPSASPFYLVDLPGYGYAKVSRTERERWGALIGRYLLEREPLRVAVHLVDSRHDPTALDRDVMQWMKASAKPYLIALTKADKLSRNKQQQSVATLRRVLREVGLEVPSVLTSAAKKTGGEELLGWIDTLRGLDGR